jgi:hypothetical protein
MLHFRSHDLVHVPGVSVPALYKTYGVWFILLQTKCEFTKLRRWRKNSNTVFNRSPWVRDQTVAVDYEVVIADYLGVIVSVLILTSSKMIQENPHLYIIVISSSSGG